MSDISIISDISDISNISFISISMTNPDQSPKQEAANEHNDGYLNSHMKTSRDPGSLQRLGRSVRLSDVPGNERGQV